MVFKENYKLYAQKFIWSIFSDEKELVLFCLENSAKNVAVQNPFYSEYYENYDSFSDNSSDGNVTG